MDQGVTVAVVRGELRRGAVAQALALLADDLRVRVAPRVLIHPWLGRGPSTRGATHPDTLSATLDLVLALGARDVEVVGVAEGAHGRFRRLRYDREAHGRPVRFLDLRGDGEGWLPIAWEDGDGNPVPAYLPAVVARSGCRVSPGTQGSDAPAGLANTLSAVRHPSPRVASAAASAATPRGGRKPAKVPTANPSAIARHARPDLSVVEVRGRTGRRDHTVVAGTDVVAVDAVAAMLRGVDPARVGVLQAAQAAGLGTADMARIAPVGDPLDRGRGRTWTRSGPSSPPRRTLAGVRHPSGY